MAMQAAGTQATHKLDSMYGLRRCEYLLNGCMCHVTNLVNVFNCHTEHAWVANEYEL